MGGRGSVSTSYQGKNAGSGVAHGRGASLWNKEDSETQKLYKDADKYNYYEAYPETFRQLAGVSSPDDYVTIYRATPGKTINSGDWIFLDYSRADSWTRSPFSGQTKPGFSVVQAKVKVKNIDWSGKNVEFVYTGKRSVRK